MTLSIQKFQDPASCLTYVWTSCVILVWILSESSSEFLFEFLSEICLSFCLNFVWNVSEFCLNYCVWIWSEFSIFPLFYRASIDSDMSEVCWKLSEFCSESCRNFGLNVVWILVWILSEFRLNFCLKLSECLNFVWIISEFWAHLGGRETCQWGSSSENNWGRKISFERQISAIEASLQWQCRKRPLDKKGVLGFFQEQGLPKNWKTP